MWILNVEFCMLAPLNIRANIAEAEELISEIYLCPATVLWEGGGMSSSKPRSSGPTGRDIPTAPSSASICKKT